MAKTPKAAKAAMPKSDKRNYTIWAKTPEQSERIEAAVANASRRAGVPISTSSWLLAQVMKGVDEEETRAAAEKKKDAR